MDIVFCQMEEVLMLCAIKTEKRWNEFHLFSFLGGLVCEHTGSFANEKQGSTSLHLAFLSLPEPLESEGGERCTTQVKRR